MEEPALLLLLEGKGRRDGGVEGRLYVAKSCAGEVNNMKAVRRIASQENPRRKRRYSVLL
jgi:hypothetical protein